MKRYALLSSQGTACPETVLTEQEYTPEMRANIERAWCGPNRDPDSAIPGTWTDVTENDACWSGSPDPSDPDNFWIDDATGKRVPAPLALPLAYD